MIIQIVMVHIESFHPYDPSVDLDVVAIGDFLKNRE